MDLTAVAYATLASRRHPEDALTDAGCLTAQGIEDLEAALRLQPTSAALAQDRADAIAALTAEEGLMAPTTSVRVPVTAAGRDAQPAEMHAAAATEPVSTGLRPAASRRLSAGSNIDGSGPRGGDATQEATADVANGRAAVRLAEVSAQASAAPSSAGAGMPLEQLESTAAPQLVLAPAATSDIRLSPAQPVPVLADVPGQNGSHTTSASLLSTNRPEQGKAQLRQPSDFVDAAQPSDDTVLKHAEVPTIAAAAQAARAAALRPAASGAPSLVIANSPPLIEHWTLRPRSN